MPAAQMQYAVLAGNLLLGLLPFLLFGFYLYFRSVWWYMYKHRARYIYEETIRVAWNEQMRREVRLRDNAIIIVMENAKNVRTDLS